MRNPGTVLITQDRAAAVILEAIAMHLNQASSELARALQSANAKAGPDWMPT